ncbi:hypothetical protein OAN36_03910 [Flavobacteriaceae bacterium]|nr:hypothetical protein [Flavobacteriaceae bacterium]
MRLFSLVLFLVVFISCSSSKLDLNGCDNINSQNYSIEKIIKKELINNLPQDYLLTIKQELISQISSSIQKESKLFMGSIENEGYEMFGQDVLITSYGYLNDPDISYCKRNGDYLAILSTNKKEFIQQTKTQFENEIDINTQTISSVLRNFDSSKYSFNSQQAKKFNIKFQQLNSMHSLVVNDKNYSSESINSLNNKLAKFSSKVAELSKLSYIFDDQKTQVSSKINKRFYKEAYLDLIILINSYGQNSIEGSEISSILKNLEYKVQSEWETNSTAFYNNIRGFNIGQAEQVLAKLSNLTITTNYKNKFKIHKNVFTEARQKFEREKLLSNSPKNQEIYFGINATTSYGNIISSDTSISLDSETSNFNLDRVLPSYKIGYKYYFKPEKRLGVFFNYKSNSSKFIELSSSSESDYEFPFTSNFNEVQVGFSAGAFDLSFGKIIKPMSVNNQEIEFNTASLNLSIITTDGRPKGEKNYFNLYGGINLISDFEDTNYMNFVIGLNYHIRFNRKLNKSDKTYLSKF